MLNAYGYKDIGTWLHDNKVPSGCTKANVEYLRKLRECIDVFSKNNALLFFLVTKLEVTDCRKMLLSGIKQKELMKGTEAELKKRMVTKEYIPVFERSIKAFNNRAEHVHRIISENIYLTEYYPYFESRGFDLLIDFDKQFGDEELLYIVDDFQKFKEEHPELIADHMEHVRHEIERSEKHRQKVWAEKKAEQEYLKEISKLEKARKKQIAKETNKLRNQERQLERSFERYYK